MGNVEPFPGQLPALPQSVQLAVEFDRIANLAVGTKLLHIASPVRQTGVEGVEDGLRVGEFPGGEEQALTQPDRLGAVGFEAVLQTRNLLGVGARRCQAHCQEQGNNCDHRERFSPGRGLTRPGARRPLPPPRGGDTRCGWGMGSRCPAVQSDA